MVITVLTIMENIRRQHVGWYASSHTQGHEDTEYRPVAFTRVQQPLNHFELMLVDEGPVFVRLSVGDGEKERLRQKESQRPIL